MGIVQSKVDVTTWQSYTSAFYLFIHHTFPTSTVQSTPNFIHDIYYSVPRNIQLLLCPKKKRCLLCRSLISGKGNRNLLPRPVVQKTTKHRDQWSNNPEYESRMQDTLERLRSGEFKSFREAASAKHKNVSCMLRKL